MIFAFLFNFAIFSNHFLLQKLGLSACRGLAQVLTGFGLAEVVGVSRPDVVRFGISAVNCADELLGTVVIISLVSVQLILLRSSSATMDPEPAAVDVSKMTPAQVRLPRL